MKQRCLSIYLSTLLLTLIFFACDSNSDKQQDAGLNIEQNTSDKNAFVWESLNLEEEKEYSISGVWGIEDQIFFIGGKEEQGLILRKDGGRKFIKMQLPEETPLLVWAYGFAKDNIFAVGLEGAFLHYNGQSWQKIETGTQQQIWGIFGFSANDLWLVGGDPNEGEPLILHYDGQNITKTKLPEEVNPIGAHSLFKVWGIEGDIYAVGQYGMILHYNGQDWERIDAGALANEDFISIWGSEKDNITIAGGRGNARIVHYNGQDWETVAPTGIGGLSAVTYTPDNQILVAGVEGTAAIFDPQTKKLSFENIDSRMDIHALWNAKDVSYAVGGSFLIPHRGLTLIRRAK